MKGVLKLGRIAGIKIEVHWTFSLLLIWVVYLDLRSGGNITSAILNVSLILSLFFCVVLHELGHALTARRFAIQTKRITLLPIGGVASLEKMPEKPGQELLVALAGPAVNVVIAILLALVVPVRKYLSMDFENIEALLSSPGLETLLFYLLIANVMLVIFNLIPAFPMDGGRVLRALLSYGMGRVKATEVAATLGQILAVIFFILGLMINPFLVLIAFFIFFGAYGENKMVKQEFVLHGHYVKEAMLTQITIILPTDSLQRVIEVVLAGTEKDFVVAENGKIVGILDHKTIIEHAKDPSVLVGDIMKRDFKTIDSSLEIQRAIGIMSQERSRFFPVVEKHKLIGAINTANINEFILLKANFS
ncbi:site-2 protease family protein [Poritiphilus flavus]|nr:site-2 protease family protein [Poritiphilus flavus]